jgi:uncharacterized membrane protein (UPF0127 family)
VIIIDQTTKCVIAAEARLADDPWSRMRGLLGRRSLPDGEALVITRCQSIHMFFMRFAIDVVFVDRALKVVGVVSRIPPFAMSRIFWTASEAIELPAGTIDRLGIAAGHILRIDRG